MMYSLICNTYIYSLIVLSNIQCISMILIYREFGRDHEEVDDDDVGMDGEMSTSVVNESTSKGINNNAKDEFDYIADGDGDEQEEEEDEENEDSITKRNVAIVREIISKNKHKKLTIEELNSYLQPLDWFCFEEEGSGTIGKTI